MKTKLFKKSCSSILIASSFLVLTACGGGGGSDAAPEAAVGSAEWIAEQQAILDAESAISAFDDSMFDVGTCTADDVINDATETSCVQALIDAIDAPDAA